MPDVSTGHLSLDSILHLFAEQGIAPNGETCMDDPRLVAVARELATVLQERSVQLRTREDRAQQAELDRLLEHPQDKATLTQITDQSFRSNTPSRVVDQMVHVLRTEGIPQFFSSLDRLLLRCFESFGRFLPGVVVPLVKDKMRKQSSNVILPAETERLARHLRSRSAEGLRTNVNLLGEAILGEREARNRLDRYLETLRLPEVECVSIKISTLYSQISPISREKTIQTVSERLALLYRAAMQEKFKREDGTLVSKLVYLDMEEYRDLHLTSEVFMATMSMPGMEEARSGIALQAYVPDSAHVQVAITRWAKERVRRGETPVTIRIVKGANMEMEKVEASIRGWPQAPYTTKRETDANYKRMLRFGLDRENNEAVRLGIASHNLFDLAYAIVLAVSQGALDWVQFEMLEGMANHQRRALFETVQRVLLYAPACQREEFINAIGYLIRRLDENTGPENFLRHAFSIQAGSPDWKELENAFLESVKLAESVSNSSRRTQNRNAIPEQPIAPVRWQEFSNEPDTDFSLPQNSQWAKSIIDRWEGACDSSAGFIPVSIGAKEVPGAGAEFNSLDPSRKGVVVARYRQASTQQIRDAVNCAAKDGAEWGNRSPDDRYQVLRQVAQELRLARADLIGAALADGGKTILESDPEVSEAIDFVEFYARCAADMNADKRFRIRPAGVVVVVSPWNFPIAIPCGGIAAALAAGNRVLLKPASDTVLPAYILCRSFWKGGVPREALQFVPCSGATAGAELLSRPEIDRVILTGGTETALRILRNRPDLQLFAETGGKNATIVSGLSDRDLAIKNVLHSAFSHAGQKCSATSLLLLEEEVFESRAFKEQLIDAIESLRVGSAWDLSTKMGPLIRPPGDDLLRGLSQLETGESWGVRPEIIGGNPCQYTPAVKWGTQPNGFTHLTELFGPVLGVMKYKTLEEAIGFVNATGYGLTSGLESLDEREHNIWRDSIRAGNLYINRPTTGAVVLRQPFGGLGKSAFGPGAKAGGPNYVSTLVEFDSEPILRSKHSKERNRFFNLSPDRKEPDKDFSEEIEIPSAAHLENQDLKWFVEMLGRSRDWFLEVIGEVPDIEDHGEESQELADEQAEEVLDHIRRIVHSYDRFAAEELLQNHDHFKLVGQDNWRRYLPATPLRIRVAKSDSILGIVLRILGSVSAGCRCVISFEPGFDRLLINDFRTMTEGFSTAVDYLIESDESLVKSIEQGEINRVRYGNGGEIPEKIHRVANEHQVYLAIRPVSHLGCIELLNYVVEQSISMDYHRYGNLGRRSQEHRSPVL